MLFNGKVPLYYMNLCFCVLFHYLWSVDLEVNLEDEHKIKLNVTEVSVSWGFV